MRRELLSAGAMAALFTNLVPGQAARAEDSVLKARLIACPSDKTVIGGVNACGKVWKLRAGDVELGADGKIKVQLHGLVLNDASTGSANGTPDGVDAVAIALICGAGSSATVAAQTDAVAFGKQGDASIDAKLSLNKECIAPVVLVRERYEGKIGGWLAATGF
jgi:hypothetical protein